MTVTRTPGQVIATVPPEADNDPKFAESDWQQLASRGISEAQVREQLRFFAKPAFYVELARPCTLGDGIRRIPEEQYDHYLRCHAEAADSGRFLKFVPASGAASRMFQIPCQYYHCGENPSLEEIAQAAGQGDPVARSFLTFYENLERFAFFDVLRTAMRESGLDLQECRSRGRYREILHYLLTEAGLNYQVLPKGLLKFHAYGSYSRTPVEEHLVEAAFHVKDKEGRCRVHFTILPEYEEKFRRLVEEKRRTLEKQHSCRLEVTFSFQSPATDTIVVDLENRPCRDEYGRLLFWPGGHGALLENLNRLAGDLVYVKNIDNVVPDRLKGPSLLWKRLLGGYLAALQEKVHRYLRQLAAAPAEKGICQEVRRFAAAELLLSFPAEFDFWSPAQQRDFLVKRLNRPLRVCGVVKNEGEPGGAPFWVREADGSLSLQIVETAQVNLDSPAQREIWAASTHFNPVDLVLGLRDFRGQPFNLPEFVNPEAVFVSYKSRGGKQFKVLERPGLWNGAMARWLTVFVEVPLVTFNPVKTVLDLLRPEHQP
uniref:DUF4301 family protein n=1 Tax=Desulfobacca acetoxidans TaxID=60893 RepID=A0A7C3SHS1_9BACT